MKSPLYVFKFIAKQSFFVNLLFAILLMVLVGFLFFQSLGWLTHHGSHLKVPSVTGLKVDKALDLLEKEGFEVIAAFDAHPESARNRGISVPVHPDSMLEEFIVREHVKLAILCVPVEFAQAVVNRLISSGIQGLLNFSPIVLEVPPEVTVNNVDLALELEHLSYFIR